VKRLLLASAFLAACVEEPFPVKLKFTGNAVFSEAMLRKAAIDSGCRDVEACQWKIQEIYYDSGYINAKIETAPLELKIEEGDRFTLGVLSIYEIGPEAGAPVLPPDAFPVKEGEVFRRRDIAQLLATIQQKYAAAGFPYAFVTPITHVDPEAKTIAIEFEVSRTGVAP
jgi:outer membrane protein assembly factor BamA